MGGLELDEASLECDDFPEEEVAVFQANLIICLSGAKRGHCQAGNKESSHKTKR